MDQLEIDYYRNLSIETSMEELKEAKPAYLLVKENT